MNLVEKAIVFAVKAHEGQQRKLTPIPYILHPVEVAAIIATMTTDETIIAAGVLHDTIEDCGVTAEEITENFGVKVSALVQSESEDKLSDRPPEETWKERKEDSLLMLKNTKNLGVKIMWMADKLSNIRSFYRSYLVEGDAVWSHLNQKDPRMQGWYYKTVAEYLKEDLGETAAYNEYCELVSRVFDHDKEENK